MHPLKAQSTSAFNAAAETGDEAEKQRLLEAAQSLAEQNALADAYAFLQRVVGLIAVTLPFVVIIGNALSSSHGLQGSISAYYYTNMGNYFVGSLFALGVFFWSFNYRPLPKYQADNWLSDVAGLMAVCVALFPTASEGASSSGGSQVVATVHLVCAGVLFVLLAVFALVFFTRTDDPSTMTARKRLRNVVYRTCGTIIASAIVLVIVTEIVKPPSSWHSFLVLETLMVVAFGVSWLVKGGFLGILADE